MVKKEDELQKKIVQFQILETTLKTLQERAEFVNQNVEELKKTKSAIEDLEKTKPNKALIPLGSGNFVYGSIEDSENVIVGIGCGVAIKKKRGEAIDILNNKIEELENILNDISTKAQAILGQLEQIQIEVEKLQE